MTMKMCLNQTINEHIIHIEYVPIDCYCNILLNVFVIVTNCHKKLLVNLYYMNGNVIEPLVILFLVKDIYRRVY